MNILNDIRFFKGFEIRKCRPGVWWRVYYNDVFVHSYRSRGDCEIFIDQHCAEKPWSPE